jgi:hypothetical protein
MYVKHKLSINGGETDPKPTAIGWSPPLVAALDLSWRIREEPPLLPAL